MTNTGIINITIAFMSLICLIVIMIVYFTSLKVKNKDTKLYSILLFSIFSESIFGIIAFFLLNNDAILDFVNRCYLSSMALWIGFFCLYIVEISKEVKKKILSFLTNVFLLITIVLSFFLQREIVVSDKSELYANGPAVIIVYLFSVWCLFVMFYTIIKNKKNIINKKYIPVLAFSITGLVIMIVQGIKPELFLFTPAEIFVSCIMYFTIENPDVKMLEEFRIAKDRAEKANEEKELFLYNITQDIREPLKEITRASNWLNENTRNKNVIDATYYINKNASNITDLVNNVLDISTLELTNIKVYNTRYNINNIYKFIEKTYKGKISDKVDFRMNIDSNIPTILYGDNIRLKQAIQMIIENSIKYTKEGFIDFKINSINKKDIVRLLITIEDSGTGIKPSEMEEILNKDIHLIQNEKIDDNTKNIAMAKSIVNLLGGTLLIDSELGRGTKMTIVLDQKIYDEKSIELNKIETDVNKFIDNTKVLLVIEDEEYREKVIKKLSRYELDLEVVELGSKCLDNIRMSKKYDLIIMDESLTHLSSIEIITKLKEIPSFDIPVALLTENTDNKGYINNGFSYLVDKKIPSKEIEEILDSIEK